MNQKQSNRKVLEGEKLADYLQQMPYDDFVSLMEDMTLVGMEQSPNNGLGAAGAHMQGRGRDTASQRTQTPNDQAHA